MISFNETHPWTYANGTPLETPFPLQGITIASLPITLGLGALTSLYCYSSALEWGIANPGQLALKVGAISFAIFAGILAAGEMIGYLMVPVTCVLLAEWAQNKTNNVIESRNDQEAAVIIDTISDIKFALCLTAFQIALLVAHHQAMTGFLN